MSANASAGDAHPWVIADIAPPFVEKDERGRLSGIVVDYVEEVLSLAGIQTPIISAPWPRISKETSLEQNLIAFVIVRNEQREDLFHWIEPITRNRHQLFSIKYPKAMSSLNTLSNETVTAVLYRDYREELLNRMGKPVLAGEDWANTINLLLDGKTDFLFASQGAIDMFCNDAIQACDSIKPVYTHSETTTYLVLAKNSQTENWVVPLKKAARQVKNSPGFRRKAQQWSKRQSQFNLTVHYTDDVFSLWQRPSEQQP